MNIANLSIYKGDTHLLKIDLTENGYPADLSGIEFFMEVRAANGDVFNPSLTLEDEVLTAVFPSSMTANVGWSKATYDLRGISSAGVKTFLRGSITIIPSVSHIRVDTSGFQVKQNSVSVDLSGGISASISGQGSVNQSFPVKPKTEECPSSQVGSDFVERLQNYLSDKPNGQADSSLDDISDEFMNHLESYFK